MRDIIVIGAGAVGLASAYQLLQKNPRLKLTVLEKEDGVARHQTGHNSGVIHSGIYYTPGGSKARNCVEGYRLLLDFCREEGVPYDVCGKIIVAVTPDEVPRLEQIYQRGGANGLRGLQMLSREEMREREPHVEGRQAILVPQAGIISFAAVAEKYAEKIRAAGGEIHFGQTVRAIRAAQDQASVETDTETYTARRVISCGGLYSDRLAAMTAPGDYQIIPFRGEYYEIKPERQHLVRHLIYPVPNPNFPFLGVHFTRMIEGGIEAGPNAVLAFRREGYRKTDVDARELWETLSYPGFRKIAARYWRDGLYEMFRSWSKAAFVRALQRLVPDIQSEDLEPGRAGVRAMACDPQGTLIDDFLIRQNGPVTHVCNAPSPAATASLAIGLRVAELI